MAALPFCSGYLTNDCQFLMDLICSWDGRRNWTWGFTVCWAYHDTHHPNEDQTCETNEKVQSASFTNRSLPVNSLRATHCQAVYCDYQMAQQSFLQHEDCQKMFFLSQLKIPTVDAHLDVDPCFTTSHIFLDVNEPWCQDETTKAPSRAAWNDRPAYWRASSSCKWGERPLFKSRSQWSRLI